MSLTAEEKEFILAIFGNGWILTPAQGRVLGKLSTDEWKSAHALHEPQETLTQLVKLGLVETKRGMSNGLGAVPNPLYRALS